MCSIFAALQCSHNHKYFALPHSISIVSFQNNHFISLMEAQCRKVHQVESVPVHVPWTDCCQQWLHLYLSTSSLQKRKILQCRILSVQDDKFKVCPQAPPSSYHMLHPPPPPPPAPPFTPVIISVFSHRGAALDDWCKIAIYWPRGRGATNRFKVSHPLSCLVSPHLGFLKGLWQGPPNTI